MDEKDWWNKPALERIGFPSMAFCFARAQVASLVGALKPNPWEKCREKGKAWIIYIGGGSMCKYPSILLRKLSSSLLSSVTYFCWQLCQQQFLTRRIHKVVTPVSGNMHNTYEPEEFIVSASVHTVAMDVALQLQDDTSRRKAAKSSSASGIDIRCLSAIVTLCH